ncbi:MAG: hypothetical protein KGI51_13155 [Rhodospirillales bacterium]|nr:hypothetical protein [Rhodospirillales bacterium]
MPTYSVEPTTYRAGHSGELPYTAALVGRIEGLVRTARAQDDEEVTQRLSRLLVNVASRDSWPGATGELGALPSANDP